MIFYWHGKINFWIKTSLFRLPNVWTVGMIMILMVWLILPPTVIRAQTIPGKSKASPLALDNPPKAEVSVWVSDSTFAFGTKLLDSWLNPLTSVIGNDGTDAENFVGRISQFTDGTNNWDISASTNGADSIRAQWSITSETGPWTDISAYDTDFAIATNVAIDDSVILWFRIQTPTSTSSYYEHSSILTVTAQQY